MRKIALVAALATLGLTGVAYAAVTVTNQYVVNARLNPVKSGTKKHPVPVSGLIGFTTTTTPKGYRPAVIQKYTFRFQGLRENTNAFPACSTSRVVDPAQGPATCPKGSLAGSGYFIAEAGSPGNQKQVLLTCRADVTLFNGGNHSLVLYVAPGKASEKPSPCPLPSAQGYAINVKLSQSSRGLLESFTVPNALRHPSFAGTTFDVGVVRDVTNILLVKKTVKKHTVGLFESVSCPANHQRQVAITFRQENGSARTATRLVRCR